MDTHSLAVARDYLATAIAFLENASAILNVGDTVHMAEGIASTASIASMDLRIVSDAQRELAATINAAREV